MKSLKTIIFSLVFLFSAKAYSRTLEWTGTSFFPRNQPNLVSYIDFGDVRLWGNVEVTLTSTYSYQNATGLYRKSYDIGYDPNIFYSNSSEVTSAFGPVADQWKLGDFELNSANHLVIPIYHLVSAQNQLFINIKALYFGTASSSLISIIPAAIIPHNQKRDFNHINGKLSIGTSKTDEGASLTVAGNISSREIKVKIDAGADFVFDRSYDLPNLDSVEHFIKRNNHLPDIQPASDMKASGLEVGNFQIKLLQKIEELTLLMIRENKQKKTR